MVRTGFMTAAGVACLGLAVSAAQADTFNFSITGSDTWNSKTFIGVPLGAPQLTVTGQVESEDGWEAAMVTQNEQGLGVRSATTDSLSLDGLGPNERLVLDFVPAAQLSSLTFTLVSAAVMNHTGETVNLATADGSFDKNFDLSAVQYGDTSLLTLTGSDLAALVGKQFYFTASSSRDDYRLASLTATTVPLPAAVWGGMALMGMLGVGRLRKQLHAA